MDRGVKIKGSANLIWFGSEPLFEERLLEMKTLDIWGQSKNI